MNEKGNKVTKLTWMEINTELNEMIKAQEAKFGSYAYSTGVLQSLLTTLLAGLPKNAQARELDFIRVMKATAEQ